MKFHNYTDVANRMGIGFLLEHYKKNGNNAQEIYDQAVKSLAEKYPDLSDDNYYANLRHEAIINILWRSERRPFFHIFPGFLESIQNFDISNKELSQLRLQLPNNIQSVAIEFPEEIPFIIDGFTICSVLYCTYNTDKENYIYLDIDAESDSKMRHFMFRIPMSHSEYTVDTFLKMQQERKPMPGEILDLKEIDKVEQKLYQIIILLNLISNDNEIVKPAIIKKFQQQFEETQDKKYIEKSINRGLLGWNVGEIIPTHKQIEKIKCVYEVKTGMKSPHYRNGFWGLRATGTGRVNRELRYTHGCFVNEDILNKIPHGYKDR
jgi:hypothetical protein